MTRKGSQAIPRSVENKRAKSIACNGDFGDRTFGISAPRGVLEGELFAGRFWRSVCSPDGVVCVVAREIRD
jgi:hypothetical protein